jgi:hypothetical protein
MTLYLTSAALVKNNLGADYPELTDESIEAMAVKAEAFVFYYTQISPVVTNPNGITITYSGAGTTVTLDIADVDDVRTLTLTVDGTPTALDLTATANNTLTKLIAVIDALADFSCVLADGATGSTSSSSLNDVEAQDLIAEAYTATYRTYSFPTNSETLGEMMAAAEDLAVSYCIAKILTIEATGMDYKIGQMEVSKEALSRALIKIMFSYKNSAKEHLENISDGPKRPRNAYLMKPTSSSTNVMESL